ncbi:MAG TPA: hypothetical protein V6C81_24720 [Planktothrix sp.]
MQLADGDWAAALVLADQEHHCAQDFGCSLAAVLNYKENQKPTLDDFRERDVLKQTHSNWKGQSVIRWMAPLVNRVMKKQVMLVGNIESGHITPDPESILGHGFWGNLFHSLEMQKAHEVATRGGLFPDAYAFLGNTFGFMYAFVAMLYRVCMISLRYTDPAMLRPFRIGRKGNLSAWAMTIITSIVWGYAALACVSWIEQLCGVLILFSGIPIYAYYRRLNSNSERTILTTAVPAPVPVRTR